MKLLKRLLRSACKAVLWAFIVWFFLPFAYTAAVPAGGEKEQAWLDRACLYLQYVKWHCDDPDLAGVIDYTIHRYNCIGRFDVAFHDLRLLTAGLNFRAIGVNYPNCPGVTLDPEVMDYPLPVGAAVLVHEALHDYFPYFGHGQVTPREQRLYALIHRLANEKKKGT